MSFAIDPALRLRTPGGPGRVSEGKALLLPLIMVREFENYSITANIGVEASGGERNTFASFGAGTRLGKSDAVLAEVAGTALNSSAEQHVLLNVGWRHKLDEHRAVSMSLGRDIHAGSEEARQNSFFFAYQRLFGD